MTIIRIEPQYNGGHPNQTTTTPLSEIPEGWAVIPDDMKLPDTFPFVNITTDGQLVTSITPGIISKLESKLNLESLN